MEEPTKSKRKKEVQKKNFTTVLGGFGCGCIIYLFGYIYFFIFIVLFPPQSVESLFSFTKHFKYFFCNKIEIQFFVVFYTYNLSLGFIVFFSSFWLLNITFTFYIKCKGGLLLRWWLYVLLILETRTNVISVELLLYKYIYFYINDKMNEFFGTDININVCIVVVYSLQLFSFFS